jgi:hypothetical protein
MSAPTPDENGVRWYGTHMKTPFQEGFCAEQVSDHSTRWARYYQCSRKATHGEFCKQHFVPDTIEIWYRISARFPQAEITAHEYARSTDALLFDKRGRRESKHTEWYEHYQTWEHAHTALVMKAGMAISRAETELRENRCLLEKINAMVKP